MNKSKAEKNYIVLYSDEFKGPIWLDYCKAIGVSTDSTKITIQFLKEDINAE